MLLRRLLQSILFTALACSAATTVTVTFTALPTSTVDLGGDTYYAGFSTATVNGIPSQYLICDDFKDQMSTSVFNGSDPLIYDFSTLSSDLPLGNSAPVEFPSEMGTLYKQAAVLVYDLATTGGLTGTQIGDYQAALWSTLDPSQLPAGSLDSGAQADIAAAQHTLATASASWLNALYASTNIYTPDANSGYNKYVCSGTPQEFMQYNTAATAPEPCTALLGGGLILAGLSVRRYRRR
jgi:hypothetical protein